MPKVVYIASWSRSGSTVLDRVLGGHPDFVPVGELIFFWERGFTGATVCGCGKPVPECDFWKEVVAKAWPEGMPSVEEVFRIHQRALRLRHMPLLFSPLWRRRTRPVIAPLIEHLRKLYGAIGDVSGAKVIVDSSKFPMYAWVLSQVPGVELHLVHLVRDPRAVVWSEVRRKKNWDDREAMHRGKTGPAKLALSWELTQRALAWLGKRPGVHVHPLKYETLMEQPREGILELLGELGEEPKIEFTGERSVMVGQHHTVSGNRNRFDQGEFVLKSDEAWREEMPTSLKRLVGTLTLSGRTKYGYLP